MSRVLRRRGGQEGLGGGDSRACHLNSGLEASKVSSEATHITLAENKPKQRRVARVSFLCFGIYFLMFSSKPLSSRQNIINGGEEINA